MYNDTLRLAILLSDSDSNSFNIILLKIIEVILYEEQKRLTKQQLIDVIKNKYGLTFVEEEITHALEKQKRNLVLILNKYQLALSPEGDKKYRDKEKKDEIHKILKKFFEENNNDIDEFSKYEKVLYTFFLNSINNNIKDLLLITNKTKISPLLNNTKFSNQDKLFINNFLNWENKEKDKLIYKIVIFCCDYCFLTVKNENLFKKEIFTNKIFMLDTNVIFRLLGLNNSERMKATEAFIAKCKKVGIVLSYSNYTEKELEESIEHNVNNVFSATRARSDISENNYINFTQVSCNRDYLKLYLSWAKQNYSDYEDKSKFKRYIKQEVSKILSKFKKVTFTSYENGFHKREFIDACQSLTMYKSKTNPHIESIKVDVNNWFYIKYKRDENNSSDIYNTKIYLISTDNNFANWSSEFIPGVIPLVMRPSSWYSLILKYTGRTEKDDYLAFSSFLSFRLHYEEEEFDYRRPEILEKVISEIKYKDLANEILVDINDKLRSEYKDIDDVNYIVETSRSNILKDIKEQGKIIGQSDIFKALVDEETEKCLKRYFFWNKIKFYLYLLIFVIFIITLYLSYKNGILFSQFDQSMNINKYSVVQFLSFLSLFLDTFFDYTFNKGDEIKIRKKVEIKLKERYKNTFK